MSPCHDAAMRKYLALAVIPLLVSCGSGEESAVNAATPATAKASPTTSAPLVAKVGDATICTLLIDRKPAPFTAAIGVMKKDYEPGDEETAVGLATELDGIAARAESAVLATHVGALATELRAIFEDGKTDTADFVASATEVNNACGNTARF